jgi:octaprenyl-diphosphate synthase
VEISARLTSAQPPVAGWFAAVSELTRPHLQSVEKHITEQAASFDPAVEGYVSYAVSSRGKRLRPLVTLLSGGASGGITKGHVDLAVIIELIHLATLVHDDVMDEAETRRSQPTVNARWGNALSVLLGDCLFAHALNLSTYFEDADISRGIARAAREVCSGEIIQTQRRFDLQLSVDDYVRIVRMKTGALFSAASEFAGLLNEADEAVVAALRKFGSDFGTAYQIYDDCLDIAGDEEATGKTLGTDLRHGKLTLPILAMMQNASEFERARCCSLLLDGRIGEIADLLVSPAATAALNDAITFAGEMISDATRELSVLPVTEFSEGLLTLASGLRAQLEELRS